MGSLEDALKNAKENQVELDRLTQEIQELRNGVQYITCFIESVDVPDRSCVCKVLGASGLRTINLRCWTDSLALQILEMYSSGKSKFIFRLHGGYISQILPDNYLPGKIEELSRELNRPVITSQLSKNDNVTTLERDALESTGMKRAIDKVLQDWSRVKRQ